MKNRIPDAELLALTPDTWEVWYQRQAVELRASIIATVDSLMARGLDGRQAMVTVYAIVESAKVEELDRLMSLPHSVN